MKQENIKKFTIVDKTGEHTIIIHVNKKRIDPEEDFQTSIVNDKSFMVVILGIILVTAILIFMYSITLGPNVLGNNTKEEETCEAIPGADKEARENPWAEEAKEAMAFVEEEVMTLTYNQANPSNTNENWIYPATMDEVIAMARVIYNEARGQSRQGKVAVGATLLNRHFSNNKLYSGKNLVELATQQFQYAYSEVPIYELEKNGCIDAAKAALRGEDPTRKVFTQTGALFFYNPEFCSEEALAVRTGIEEMVIGEHHFHVSFNEM